MANRLAEETSTYLLQHADNPVDWYPWSPEALARARAEDKPILLSIGYSACHWCHVMERESFEDAGTAAFMNEHFVNVKVDREERPDVDSVYMRAVQALTGRGGWPLTAFLTPDGEPYYGGTYFPPEPRPGMPSFRQVLEAARNAWDERRQEVLEAAGQIRAALERSTEPEGEGMEVGPELMDHARRFLAGRFDPSHGGFGSAPKFPQPPTLEFLLRHHHATGGNPEAFHMVRHTLVAMARGGIRDHLGGGFHRYSVDAGWLVPHFEKMLYDNALLARLYVQAWQVTGEPELREAAETTLDWLLDDMRVRDGDGAPVGAFYAARDADSEGEEGLFYLWTPGQVEEVLGPTEAALFARVYDVTEEGNFEGRNILHLRRSLEAEAEGRGMRPEELRERLRASRSALLEARSEREPPLRDGKVLAGWNGMAVRVLAEAGGAFGRGDYVDAAREVLGWLLETLRPEGPDGPLVHGWAAGRPSPIPAFLEDVAALGNAALTLHEVTLEPAWLLETRRLAARTIGDFWDEEAGVFYDTSGALDEARELVLRPRETMDNATPSGTSLAIELCLRAGHLFDDDDLEGKGRRALSKGLEAARRHPSAFGRLLAVAQGTLAEPLELAVVGSRDDPATGKLLSVVLARYLPERTVTGREPDEEIGVATPLLEGRGAVDDRPTAYLCRNYVCERPVTEPEALEALLPG